MKAKTSDKILLGILTIGVGAIVCLLSPTKKTSAFLIGSSAGLATSLYVINTKNKVEQKSHKQNLKFDSSTTTYQPQLDNQTQEEIADVSNDELSSYSTEKISTWLESKAIEVKDSQTPRAYDRTYDRLTLLLGNDYPHLQKFYLCIKKRLSDGKSFKLDLATKDVKTISKITNFGSKLHEYTFLSHYRYSSTTKAIFATPNRTGSIINFFTGQWFERFIYLKISQFLTQQGLDYQYQLNTKIVTCDSKDFELDILFASDRGFLWIECKTGNYQNYIDKYSQFRKNLDISKKQSLLVILDLSDRLASELTQMYDITVSNQNLVLKHVSEALNIDFPETSNTFCEVLAIGEPRTVQIKRKTLRDRQAKPEAYRAELKSILTKAKIRPFPESRSEILRQLITIVSSDRYSTRTLKQIREQIFEQSLEISKTMLMEVFNTLMMSNCLLDESSKPVYSFNQNVTRLASNSLDDLEQKCIKSYILVVLLTDRDYFDLPSNLSLFQATVGIANSKNIDFQNIKNLADRIDKLDCKLDTVYFNLQ